MSDPNETCGDVLLLNGGTFSRTEDAICELPAGHMEWHQMTDIPDKPLRWIKGEDWI